MVVSVRLKNGNFILQKEKCLFRPEIATRVSCWTIYLTNIWASPFTRDQVYSVVESPTSKCEYYCLNPPPEACRCRLSSSAPSTSARSTPPLRRSPRPRQSVGWVVGLLTILQSRPRLQSPPRILRRQMREINLVARKYGWDVILEWNMVAAWIWIQYSN